ncbi:MAG: GNAT family N-acetyltransferase [Lachnospira sp.]
MNTGDYTIERIHKLSGNDSKALEKLCRECDDYEPFFDDEGNCDIYMLAARYNSRLIGFLSLLRLDSSDPYELTALVSPAHRNHGVFSDLLSEAKKYMSESTPDTSIICAVPKEYSATKCVGDILFEEYLMTLSSFITEPCETLHHETEQSAKDLLPGREYCFTDDFTSFLVYKDESAPEPCALLNLDYQQSFTGIYGVFVDEDIRHQGIGTLLMHDFIDEYSKTNSLPLVLNVRSTNTAAVALYKKCGFTIESHIPYYNII